MINYRTIRQLISNMQYLNPMNILQKVNSLIKMWLAVTPHRFIGTEVIFMGGFCLEYYYGNKK